VIPLFSSAATATSENNNSSDGLSGMNDAISGVRMLHFSRDESIGAAVVFSVRAMDGLVKAMPIITSAQRIDVTSACRLLSFAGRSQMERIYSVKDQSAEVLLDAVAAVGGQLISLLKCLIENTKNFLSDSGVRDVRVHITKLLLGLLCGGTLDYDRYPIARRVLEVFCVSLVRVVKECVTVVVSAPPAQGEGDMKMSGKWFRERVEMEEAGWYLLKVVENVWPLFKRHCCSEAGDEDRRRGWEVGERTRKELGLFLRESVLNGTVFGGVEVMASMFATSVLDIMGLEIFDEYSDYS
jgi:hypothetical protein